MAIAREGNIDPKEWTFFDFQTKELYSHHKHGDFTFSKLVLEWTGDAISHVRWIDGHCSELVLQHFIGYTMKSDTWPKARNLAVAVERINPLGKFHSPNTFGDMIELFTLVDDVARRHHMKKMYMEFVRRAAQATRLLCMENGFSEGCLDLIPRDTRFGKESDPLYLSLCKWAIEQHRDIRSRLGPILFYV